MFALTKFRIPITINKTFQVTSSTVTKNQLKTNISKQTYHSRNDIIPQSMYDAMNPNFWNSPRDNLSKSKWVQNAIDIMIDDFDKYKTLTPEKVNELIGHPKIEESGHSGSTFSWTINVAHHLLENMTKEVEHETMTKKIDTLKNIMKTDSTKWLKKEVTHLYDNDLQTILTEDIKTFKYECEMSMGYIYYHALKKLHNDNDNARSENL